MQFAQNNATTTPSSLPPTIATRRLEIDDLDAAIVTLSKKINSDNYQLLVMIREFDERAGWAKWGFTRCREWLQWRCDLSATAARDRIRVAHALKDLPVMSDALDTGSLSYSKARALTRVATPASEEELIAMALALSAAQVETHCRQREHAAKSSVTVAKRAQDSRLLTCWRDEARGVVTITLEVPIEEGALVEQAIDQAAVQFASSLGNSSSAPGETPLWRAIRADATVAIMRDYLCGGNQNVDEGTSSTSSSAADHYQVVVHVDEDALTQQHSAHARASHSAVLKGKSELPIDTVRRLCCDGSIIPIIESAGGEPLSVGRKQRTITTGIRRALWARDKGCVFPGCSHTRFVDAHHITHWADGGETSIDNLVLVCTHHHKLVHEGGYTVKSDHAGRAYFKRPDGKAVPHAGYHRDDWEDDYSATVAEDYSELGIVPDSAESGCIRERPRLYLI